MERTLYLILAAVGYLISGLFLWAGVRDFGFVVVGLASVSLLIWAIATGVALGMREAAESREHAQTTL